ncbi:MAG: DUF5668 domain-containing protein [Chloroflexi bacterium]|nr:DUF5668 domain-containing protein [Chloroflexota bacterium]
MRRGNVFWGLILIVLGVLFYLRTIGLIKDVFEWFWPVALILLGIWVLVGRFAPSLAGSGETFSVDLQGAARLDLEVDQGAGALSISGGAPAGVAISGNKAAALDLNSQLTGESLGVKLEAGPTFLPFLGPDGGEWRFQLTQEVPVAIKLEAGASSLDLDLTDVKLTFLGVETGASSLRLKLPVNAGKSLVNIEAGAASIDMSVPEGVGARIRIEQGASSLDIDQKRFPKVTDLDGLFQSADYDSAVNRVEVNLEGGASTVKVH